MTIKLEVTRSPDASALAAIHGASFAKGWSAEAVAEMLAVAGTWAFVAQEGKGFALLRCLGGDAEILTLAVAPDCRRRGAADAIVCSLLAWAKGQGAEAVFLEVAEANEAARTLYAKNGFSVISRRKEYYHNPDGSRDDALVMRRVLPLR